MNKRVARKIMRNGGWKHDMMPHRMCTFLAAKRVLERRSRRKVAQLRAAGLWPATLVGRIMSRYEMSGE